VYQSLADTACERNTRGIVEFGEVHATQAEFAAKVEAEFARIVDAVVDERSAA